MSIKVAELTFLEHLSKRYGIPTPRHLPGTAGRAEVKAALEAWGGQGLVKPDVLAGKRGKAGSIMVVRSAQDTTRVEEGFGQGVGGKLPRMAYLNTSPPAGACGHHLTPVPGASLTVSEGASTSRGGRGGQAHPAGGRLPGPGRLGRGLLARLVPEADQRPVAA
jgi:hypothetical protein